MDRKPTFLSAKDLMAMGRGARTAYYEQIGRPGDVSLHRSMDAGPTRRNASARHEAKDGDILGGKK